MKKLNLLKIGLLSLFVATISCDNTDDNLKKYEGEQALLFGKSSSNLASSNSEVSFVEVEVAVTNPSNSDKTISFQIDPSSTADASQYTIDQSTLVIPAGKSIGKVKITANYDNIPDGQTTTLVLKFETNDYVLPNHDTHTVNLFRFCETDLAGSYSVTTTYGYHDFLPSYSTNTMNVTIAETGVNRYKVDDFSGGLYSVGPYATNYGTGAAGAATLRDLTFVVNCGAISWTGESDPWGTIVAQGTNTYDPVTGVITISWYCNGYGENGVSVYTPQ
ncbi:hypothetical protein [Flavobacterium sp. HNIBRBA15423]|uniref:hypothetical protein n=1 Tax=Flavobacterium sp. HNIBRBA15423 TaxID=3458683 RepID=UPI0040440286